MSLGNNFKWGDSTRVGHFVAPELSCREGTGAQYDMILMAVADGRGVTVVLNSTD